MKPTQVALYARVSSEQQHEARTIESQVADLRTRIAATGVILPAELEFVDNGYSGATLIRPALERLRDVAAAGGIDQVYVHCPDRLARNYAHQVLLLEEFMRAGVEVIFLNREVGQTPEDQLLLQVQGMIAEYERAKILERSRRGKRHGAQVGKVSVLGVLPTATAMSANKREPERPALRWCGRRHAWFARSLSGSDEIGAPLERFVAVWKRPRNEPEPVKRSGIVPPLAACSTTPPTKARQPLAKRRLSRCVLDCERNGDGPCNPNMPIPIRMFLSNNG